MGRPWQYDFRARRSRRPQNDAALSVRTASDAEAHAAAVEIPPFVRKPSASRIVLRTAGATALVALLGVSAFTVTRGIHLQDWGLSTWSAAQSASRGQQKRLTVQSLEDLRKLSFFDPATKKANIFYSIDAGGDIELFNLPGRNPEGGDSLKAITPAVVQQLERRLRQKEQDRTADEERKAATARADAEIARARRAQSASGRQSRDAQVTETIASTRSLPASAPRSSPTAPVDRSITQDSETLRATEYNDLVSAARTLLDAGRYGEARIKAQRAIYVDPRRQSARTLWAEAQTRLDQASASTFPIPHTRWPY